MNDEKGLQFDKAAVFGATGCTGLAIASHLVKRGVAVRVVSRSDANLARLYGQWDVERMSAEVLDREQAKRAADGCDIVFHCVGMPMDRYGDHVRAGKNTAGAMKSSGARGVLISGYWSYAPIRRTPIVEDSRQTGGSVKSKQRREQEEILLAAGAAVLPLPDFYGPTVEKSFINGAIKSRLAGERPLWPGRLDVEREFIYMPDVGAPVVALAHHEAAFGARWILGGAGAVTPAKLLAMIKKALCMMRTNSDGGAKRAKVVGPMRWRLKGLRDKNARAFSEVAPIYNSPAIFDDSRLRKLIGDYNVTTYEEGVRVTAAWLGQQSQKDQDE